MRNKEAFKLGRLLLLWLMRVKRSAVASFSHRSNLCIGHVFSPRECLVTQSHPGVSLLSRPFCSSIGFLASLFFCVCFSSQIGCHLRELCSSFKLQTEMKGLFVSLRKQWWPWIGNDESIPYYLHCLSQLPGKAYQAGSFFLRLLALQTHTQCSWQETAAPRLCIGKAGSWQRLRSHHGIGRMEGRRGLTASWISALVYVSIFMLVVLAEEIPAGYEGSATLIKLIELLDHTFQIHSQSFLFLFLILRSFGCCIELSTRGKQMFFFPFCLLRQWKHI